MIVYYETSTIANSHILQKQHFEMISIPPTGVTTWKDACCAMKNNFVIFSRYSAATGAVFIERDKWFSCLTFIDKKL